MSKFSRGNWYVDSAGVLRCDDDYDRSIAHFITSAATKELDEANARLITAAPEMYEIIQRFLFYVGSVVTDNPRNINMDDLSVIGFSALWEGLELINRIDGKVEK